jgi:hypothetical protein
MGAARTQVYRRIERARIYAIREIMMIETWWGRMKKENRI